jgi:hypothetical protein
VAEIIFNNNFFFLFFPIKKQKNKKKINIKIKFIKIKTNHLINKKDERLKYTFQTSVKATIYFTCFLHFSPLFFNPTLPPRKICNLMLI